MIAAHTTAAAFADGGYVITAATTNAAGYTLWGFKPKDSPRTFDVKLEQGSGSELDTTAAAYATGGFLLTAATTNDAGYTTWGFKAK
jgi:hypothetical protein